LESSGSVGKESEREQNRTHKDAFDSLQNFGKYFAG
jgi:hypothetical protein